MTLDIDYSPDSCTSLPSLLHRQRGHKTTKGAARDFITNKRWSPFPVTEDITVCVMEAILEGEVCRRVEQGGWQSLPPTWSCVQFAEPVESWVSSLVTCFPLLPHHSPSLHPTEAQLTWSDKWGAFPR